MLPHIAAGLPRALKITPLADQSVFVKSAVMGVVREALIAACLTASMILLFLGSWRATLIIAVSIPLAVLTSLIMLSALGETINIMTLGGLALAVGILVDDATVAIENISHHLESGKPLHEAILERVRGDRHADLRLDDVDLYRVRADVPAFRGRALSVRAARRSGGVRDVRLVFFLAHADSDARHVPAAAEHKADGDGTEGRFAAISCASNRHSNVDSQRCANGYRRTLDSAIANRRRFIAIFLLLCIGSLALVPFLGRDFFPAVDTGEIRLHLRAPTGTRIEETARITDEVEAEEQERDSRTSEQGAMLDNIGVPVSGINLTYDSSDPIGP